MYRYVQYLRKEHNLTHVDILKQYSSMIISNPTLNHRKPTTEQEAK
jgi:hypothetical protein